jgi:N-dimethylarginine dimethylaminohydrolase
MEDYANQRYNLDKAFSQFMGLYQAICREGGLVYILPSRGNFQDQTFVANLGCYLPHITNNNTILLSKFKSAPRVGEELVGLDFFLDMEYNVIQPDTTFEGEADLKYLRDNIYVGGYGIRTDLRTHHWLMDITGAEVIPIEMDDEGLYHFDCMFLPLTSQKALVATSAMKPADLRKVEKLVEVIDVPREYLYNAWTNCLVMGNKVLYGPSPPSKPDIGKTFSEFIIKAGFEPVLVNLSEFELSGAGLSCFILHLNYWK